MPDRHRARLSGQIHRLVVTTKHGGTRSFVVKQESGAAVERELLFRSHCEELVRHASPVFSAASPMPGAERGVLVLEDITPAAQGDVLHGCTDEEAGAVVRVLARFTAVLWNVTADGSRRVCLAGARNRWSPTAGVIDSRGRPSDFRDSGADVGPCSICRRGSRMRSACSAEGPASWLHVDAHLDNTLLRPDGTVVLLDWCNAAVGPPAVDLARFLDRRRRRVIAAGASHGPPVRLRE